MRKAAATKLSIATMVCLVCSIGAVHSSPKEEHEQQYIVGSIGKDVSEILLFAARKVGKQEKPIDFLTNENTSDLEHRSYALVLNDSGETFAQDISLAEYVWSPSNFTPWAQQFIKKFSLQPTKSTDEKSTRDFIEALSNFDTEVLAEQNKKVSTLLTEHPLDAELHEQAALLCAVFGLRESASCFTDVRSWLNRIATHLTMAQALRGNSAYGNAGKLAEIAMLCLCGRQADAVAHIDKVDSAQNSPEMKSWLRALRIRATTDYRIADVQTATVVERLEHGRALADNLSADKLTDELRRHKPVGSPIDWLRIGMRGIASVESGHVYAEPAIAAELADYSLELKLYNDKKILNNSEATEALNQQPTGCLIREPAAHLQAISWGDLSAFHARQLLDGVYQKYYFEKRMWGVPEQAASTLAQADKNVSTLDLYPLCKLSMLKASQER